MATIGALLKAERTARQLTQKQMAAGVISTSFYSKVENDFNDINTMDLIGILKANDVSVSEFMAKLVPQQLASAIARNSEQLEWQLYTAFYAADLKTIERISGILWQPQYMQSQYKYTQALCTLILALLTDKVDELSEQDQADIRRLLFKEDNWNARTLALFADSIDLYAFDELSFLINALLRRYNSPETSQDELEPILATIFINYLDTCYRQGEIQMMERPLDFLSNLRPIPSLFFYRLLGAYYKNLYLRKSCLSDNTHMIDLACDVLSALNMQGVANKLP
ncbi:MAG: helix-turn-helix domain-containing protein [Sporolactobacillus sp.]